MGKTVGIDFGTTTSSVAFHDGVAVRLFETPEGSRIMPSAVSLLKDGRQLVGQAALNELTENGEFTFINIKRHLGEPWNDNEHQGFQTVETKDGMVAFAGPDGAYMPADLTSLILRELKRMAEAEIGPVDGAVITVPSDCSEEQRKATIDAALKAGFTEVETLIEPMAAAMAYGVGKDELQQIAVYDLGGGTFDIALMNVHGDACREIKSLGIDDLGGADFDRRIANYVTDLFLQEHADVIQGQIHSAQITNIEVQSESAKKKLSTNDIGRIRATFVARDKDGNPLHLNHDLTLKEFEGLVHDYIEATIKTCEDCIQLAGKDLQQIDHVLLVGGMTRVPAVRKAVQDFFGMEPVQRNPDTIVAEGAAMKAAQIDGRIDLGHQSTAAASYGIMNPDGTMCRIIPRGAPYGTSKDLKLTTVYDGQPYLRIVLLRGDADDALDCELLELWDEPVKPGKAGKPTVKLTLTLNNQGVLEYK